MKRSFALLSTLVLLSCATPMTREQSLVNRAGVRESVVDGIPVTELVRDVEMYRPPGGGVGDGCRKFGERHSLGHQVPHLC